MECGNVIESNGESYVIVATNQDGSGYGVPVSGNMNRFSWVFFRPDATIVFNILDRIPEYDVEYKLSSKKE